MTKEILGPKAMVLLQQILRFVSFGLGGFLSWLRKLFRPAIPGLVSGMFSGSLLASQKHLKCTM